MAKAAKKAADPKSKGKDAKAAKVMQGKKPAPKKPTKY